MYNIEDQKVLQSGNCLLIEEYKWVTKVLCKNATLNCLDLQENNPGSKEGKHWQLHFARTIPWSLWTFMMNSLGSEVGKVLASALCMNLQGNDIGSGGKH